MPSLPPAQIRSHLLVLALYMLLTVLLLYPLGLHMADHVPDWGDPLEHTWTLAWNTRQLLLDPLALYQANIFYPYPNTLAFSESQIATTVLALPLLLATGNAILAYNLVFFASFVLSAFTCYLLTFDLTRTRWGGILAGLAFAFWSYKFNHISHLNLVTLQWLPLVFLALRWALDANVEKKTPNAPGLATIPCTLCQAPIDGSFNAGIRAALLFAIALTGQALSSWYYALMTGLGVTLYVVYWTASRRRFPGRQNLLALGAFTLPALVLILTFALPYFELNRRLNLTRTLQDSQELAARPISFVTVAPGNFLYGSVLPIGGADALFGGVVLLLLALVGLLGRAHLTDRAFWLLLGIVFAVLAFGPTFEITPALSVPSPFYRAMHEWIPGMQGTRAPARFFVMSMLALSVFAAQGFRVLFASRNWRVGGIAGAGLLMLMALEYNNTPLLLVPIETGTNIPAVYHWLATQPRGNYIEMPIQKVEGSPFTRPMYFSTVHWQSTPLGYGSFAPPTFVDVMSVLGDDLTPPATRILNFLREYQVRYWIFHSNAYAPEEWAALSAHFRRLDGVQLLWEQDGDYVYQVGGAPPTHPLSASSLLPHGATASKPYTAYAVLTQPRHYPIVNDDESAHTFTAEWKSRDQSILTHSWTMPLPRVLRERPEGIALEADAPKKAGDYTLVVSMDGNALVPQDANERVRVSETSLAPETPFELVAMTTHNAQPKAGEPIVLTLWWRIHTHVAENHLVNVALVNDKDETQFETTDNPLLMFTYPITQWLPNELVALEYAVPITEDAESGEYRLTIELVEQKTGALSSFSRPDGSIGTHVTHLFQIQ